MKSKVVDDLKDTDGKIKDLYMKSEEMKREILAGQKDIKLMLRNVDGKLQEKVKPF